MTHVVARIGKPHGVRGEVTVRLHTDEPQLRFVPGAQLVTGPGARAGTPPTLTLRTARWHNGVWLLGFEHVDDRDAAERLRGTHLFLPVQTLADTRGSGREGDTEDGWYQEDLLGLAVERIDGSPVGIVSGLRVGRAQDLLEVALVGGGTASVPFVTALVPVVDVAAGRVVVDPPPGLLELDT
ncbi:MAG: ribosome maturation factor RimM [Dermatophilaceae bacterium]